MSVSVGEIVEGTVSDIMNYGAFVKLNDGKTGLVHISEICDRYISHPLEAVKVGDIVDVKVMSVDLKKQRIQLTMKLNDAPKPEKKEKADKNRQNKPAGARKDNPNHGGNDKRPSNQGQNRQNKDGNNRNRNGGQRRTDFKKGNHFFDGIVIK